MSERNRTAYVSSQSLHIFHDHIWLHHSQDQIEQLVGRFRFWILRDTQPPKPSYIGTLQKIDFATGLNKHEQTNMSHPARFHQAAQYRGPLSRLVILHHLAASILSRNRWCCRVEHCGTTLKQSSRTMINYHWWLMTCRTILVFFAQLCAAIVFCYLDLFGIIDSSANHSIKHAWTSACLSCLTV